jgi:hypothetical protein
MSYKAILFAPDGDYVSDFRADTIADVQNLVADSGSRWIFYPYPFVIHDRGYVRGSQRIVDAPEGFERFRGLAVATVAREIAAESTREDS